MHRDSPLFSDDTDGNCHPDGGYWLYNYNAKGEVISGTRYDSNDTPISQQNFGYQFDDIGNREERSIDGNTVTLYAANTLNQYTDIAEGVSQANPIHDDDGNLIDDGETLYTYNGENRLIEVHRKLDNALLATYHYDEQGRRIRKTTTIDASQGATDILFLWDNWLNIAELDHDSLTITPRNYYTWGNDLSGSEQGAGGVGGLLFIRHFPADETHAYTYDGNGNVTGLYAMDNAGAESAKYEYAPFGEPLQATGPLADENPYRFSTKYHDEETEFLYYGYRYYTPATGRWINRDPIEEGGGVNLYAFSFNSLITALDILGLNRLEIAQQIVNWEARRDKSGNVRVYKLAKNDGGGTYEIAGINDGYHPKAAQRLKELIDGGNPKGAELEAVNYIAKYTDVVNNWLDCTTGLGKEGGLSAMSEINENTKKAYGAFLRDTVFNRGPGGAATILQMAINQLSEQKVSVDGGIGPQTKRVLCCEFNSPNKGRELLSALRSAREQYENRNVAPRPNFRKGLERRWDNAYSYALKFLE